MGTATKWLEGISRKTSTRPAAMVIMGQPGVGKTTMGAWVPGGLMMPFKRENSYDILKASGSIPKDLPVLPPVENWQGFLEVMDELRTQSHDHKALVIDTLSCLENLCHEYVCKRDHGGDWGKAGFQSYMQGYVSSLKEWREALDALDNLRDEKGMTIVFLEHVQVRAFKDPEGADYDRYQAACHNKTWHETHKWADACLFYKLWIEVQEDGGRAKAKGGKVRILCTEPDPAFDAKNRMNLPREIEGGASGKEAWSNLAKAVHAARKES